MCELKVEDIKSMSDVELAAFIKDHRAKTCCHFTDGVLACPPKIQGMTKEQAIIATGQERSRQALQEFVQKSAAQGRCDPVRFGHRKDGATAVITAETYVLPPAVVEEMARRLVERAA